jgi:metal-responsive CopG/Arc/MetJ family transcriptional regulator
MEASNKSVLLILPEKLLKKVDAAKNEMAISRLAFIREALRVRVSELAKGKRGREGQPPL